MMSLVLIKVGGSLITDKEKPFTCREDMMDVVAKAIYGAYASHLEASFIVANGGGSFGHYLSAQDPTENTVIAQQKRISAIHESVARLNLLVVERLIAHEVPAFSTSPSGFITCRRGEVTAVSLKAVQSLSDKRFVPVMHGDIYPDGTARGYILSAESLFEVLIGKLQAEYEIHVLLLGEVDGVLDGNGKVIPCITDASWITMGGVIQAPRGYDVTGGMKHKIESALRMATVAKSVHIISGKEPQNVLTALSGGRVGTIISA